jgi:bis(5'-nucleosyl)-tetraphosphatase (symmetrical)
MLLTNLTFAMGVMGAVFAARGCAVRALSMSNGTRPPASSLPAASKPPSRKWSKRPNPPATPHQVLRNVSDKRFIVIGDIHGCFDELLELLDLVSFDRKKDIVCLVGDLVNKGPKSSEVVSFARKNGFLSVRGNHDEACLVAIAKGKEIRDPSKIPERYQWLASLTEEDVQYLETLPYSISIPELGCIIVHAGMVPNVPLQEQDEFSLVTMRSLRECSSGGWIGSDSDTHPDDLPWAPMWAGPAHAYFGHDAKKGLQQTRWATGLDTGCVYGNQLSAAILPGGEIVSVPAQKVYHKPGKL